MDRAKQLYNILFPNSDSTAGVEVDFDLEQATYLKRLGTNGVDSLNGEVSRLNEELAIVEHQTRDMASQNYQIFVQSAQTTSRIKNYLADGSQAVGMLNEDILPSVKCQIESFYDAPCNEFRTERAVNSLLLKKRESINTLLEMPWIVRRCLAEEKLPDAIKVLQASLELMKNINEPPTILNKICCEVATLQSEIQQALLLKLSSGNIGLSECLQTVSLLRSFFVDDKALRFRYLQSRMKEISFEEGRSWIFDTLTQHRAAFGGDSNHYLSTWVSIQINRLIANLETLVDQTDSVDSLMLQANYFGESLARVGADVRGLVVPIFAEHLVQSLDQNLSRFEIKFAKNLKEFNIASAIIFNSNNPESANLDLPSTDDLNPPRQLVSYPPLALYLNDVLSALNFIGKCPLTQTASFVISKLEGSVSRIGQEIDSWGSSEMLTWESREKSEFNRLKRYFKHLLVPHLDRVVRVIFPPVSLAEVTGLGITQCAEMIRIKYDEREIEVS